MVVGILAHVCRGCYDHTYASNLRLMYQNFAMNPYQHCLHRLHSPNSEPFAECCTMTKQHFRTTKTFMHFHQNWLHHDERGFLRAEMSALLPDYRALCCIVEIDYISAELLAIFPTSTVKRCMQLVYC